MDQRKVILITGSGSGLSDELLKALKTGDEFTIGYKVDEDDIQYIADAICDDDFKPGGECKVDHGERTNYKLQDQPFYMRGRNGKMRGY